MTQIKFRAPSGKTHTLNVEYVRTASKDICYMRIVETGKQVQASGSNKAEAHNNALAKLKA